MTTPNNPPSSIGQTALTTPEDEEETQTKPTITLPNQEPTIKPKGNPTGLSSFDKGQPKNNGLSKTALTKV